MASVTGQVTFIITEEETKEKERQTIQASEFNIEWEQTDREDDKLRENVYMRYRGIAFDGNANFEVVLFYDVFGWNVFQHQVVIDVSPSYTLTIADDEPDDGFTIEAIVDLNEH